MEPVDGVKRTSCDWGNGSAKEERSFEASSTNKSALAREDRSSEVSPNTLARGGGTGGPWCTIPSTGLVVRRTDTKARVLGQYGTQARASTPIGSSVRPPTYQALP